jgi:cell division protein FtsA
VKKKELKPRSGVFAALDIGTTKVVCFIARTDDKGALRVEGIGHQVSRGVKGGTIVDMDEAEASILNAVHAAEKMARETIREVVVNVSGGYPASRTIGVEVSIAGHEVGDADLRRILDQGRQTAEPDERALIHSIPVGYMIDGSRGIRDPRGMYGHKLAANIHVVTAQTGAVRTLKTCVGRCHLDIESWVVSPFAAGLSALVEDEMDLGVTVIDMGGGTTTIAVFFDGNVVYTDGVPLGGAHVTNDIARGLSTPVADAERMKTLYGGCMQSGLDERETIKVPLVGEDLQAQVNAVPKSMLVNIIQPRLEETFEMVRARLEASGFDKVAGRRVMLTGGASQLPGVRDLAGLILDKQIRMGRPLRLAGLAESTGGPAFSVCAGLLQYALYNKPISSRRARGAGASQAGIIGRLGTWLRENF